MGCREAPEALPRQRRSVLEPTRRDSKSEGQPREPQRRGAFEPQPFRPKPLVQAFKRL